jgi:uncharacterized protein with HEPN domain
MGHAVKALPTDLLAVQPSVPWKEIARLRDLLAHRYYRVNAQVIRRTVEAPLDQLDAAVAELMAAEQVCVRPPITARQRTADLPAEGTGECSEWA